MKNIVNKIINLIILLVVSACAKEVSEQSSEDSIAEIKESASQSSATTSESGWHEIAKSEPSPHDCENNAEVCMVFDGVIARHPASVGPSIIVSGSVEENSHQDGAIELTESQVDSQPNKIINVSNIVEVFYATDRKREALNRYGAKRGQLQFGKTLINIPKGHQVGELEAPSLWRFEFKQNTEKHVMLIETKPLDKATYFSELSAQIKASPGKKAFIFIHGYNVSFEDAARRTGQMAYDLSFKGAPVFYSWPSHANSAKYTFDEANIEWSKANIENFLDQFTDETQAEKIYLVAHSMGNRALTRAFSSLLNKKPEVKSRFAEIILAAPDIDVGVFENDIAPSMVSHGVPITLYASSQDLALKASKEFHGGHPRAGESGENIVITNGIESIDSTNVKTSFLGHSEFAETKAIVSDIFYIVQEGLRAERRAGLKKSETGTYWEFK